MVNQELLIVSPLDVLLRLLELIRTKIFWLSAFNSIFRITSGFILAVVMGILLAILSCLFPIIKYLFNPIINLIKATPVASFIILALVWIKSYNLPVFISFLMVLPIVWENVIQGIVNTDKSLLEMAKFFKVEKAKILSKIYLPSVMPYFTAACTTGLGLAWKAGCAAEVIANTNLSIGGEIYKSKIYMETVDLFAWTTIIVLLSILLEKLMLYFMKRI